MRVYKIVCNVTNNVYIGSTKESLKKRLVKHSIAFRKWLLSPEDTSYYTSFKVLENNNYYIEELEKLPDFSERIELRIRERYWIENTDNVINKNRAFRTREEHKNDIKNYMIVNVIKLKEYNKKYYQNKKSLKLIS